MIEQEKNPRVLIADGEAMIGTAIGKLIEPACEVVGVVEDGRELIDAALRLCPDVIVLDVVLPHLNGVDAARKLSKLLPESRLLFLTAQASPAVATEAFRAGAAAYVLKRSSPTVLSQAIQALMNGHQFVCPLMTKDLLAAGENGERYNDSKRSLSSLTPRQREVLQLIAEGRGTKEVATVLNIAVKTVEFHKFKIMEQLDLHSTAALTRQAIAEGLVSL